MPDLVRPDSIILLTYTLKDKKWVARKYPSQLIFFRCHHLSDLKICTFTASVDLKYELISEAQGTNVGVPW
jgi:hypothetical protein